MALSPSSLAHLSPAELRHLTQAHLDGCFGQLTGAGDHLRRCCSPGRLVRRHPWLVGAVAAGAGLLVARSLRGSRTGARAAGAAAGGPAIAPRRHGSGVLWSAILGAALRLLPDLLTTVARRYV